MRFERLKHSVARIIESARRPENIALAGALGACGSPIILGAVGVRHEGLIAAACVGCLGLMISGTRGMEREARKR